MSVDRCPNLLVILSDQHNPHVAGYAGDRWVQTPALDRMAAAGTDFPNTYCPAPLCVPSRMAFMTGQYPCDMRIWTNAGVLPSDVPTFAHALSLAGYETILCGRMHFVGPDQRHGFEQRLVGDVSGAATGVPPEGLHEGVWDGAGRGQSAGGLRDGAVGPGCSTYEVYDRDVTDRACSLLAEWGRAGRSRPFCLVVGYLLPHPPYVCEPELFSHYLDALPELEIPEAADEHPAVRQLKAARGYETVTPTMIARSRAGYYGLVTTLDRNVGRILDALDEAGLRERTAVAYTSDHGDLCGEHGMWSKSAFYEGAVGIPMVWSMPGTVRRGATAEGVFSLLDLTATLLDLGGAEPLPRLRGRSLREFLTAGRPENWPDTAFAESCVAGQAPARMIRRGPWKLCSYHGFDDPQLFNLDADPAERDDLGRDPRCAGLRDELLAELRRDWDPAAIQAVRAGAALCSRWQRDITPGPGERWPFPTGCNTRT